MDIGSKSERQAVVLDLHDGGHFVLRNLHAPSFGDDSLDALVGSSIKAHGVAVGRTLIMKDWETLPHTITSGD